MNKAFVREPEPDGKGFCPRCKALGIPVDAAPMDTHITSSARLRIGDAGWFCSFARCEVAYFNEFDVVVTVDELKAPIYPKDPEMPICACFGFDRAEIEADVRDGTPTRIRELLAKSRSAQAQCRSLAADGKCCMPEVQRIYMKQIGQSQM